VKISNKVDIVSAASIA